MDSLVTKVSREDMRRQSKLLAHSPRYSPLLASHRQSTLWTNFSSERLISSSPGYRTKQNIQLSPSKNYVGSQVLSIENPYEVESKKVGWTESILVPRKVTRTQNIHLHSSGSCRICSEGKSDRIKIQDNDQKTQQQSTPVLISVWTIKSKTVFCEIRLALRDQKTANGGVVQNPERHSSPKRLFLKQETRKQEIRQKSKSKSISRQKSRSRGKENMRKGLLQLLNLIYVKQKRLKVVCFNKLDKNNRRLLQIIEGWSVLLHVIKSVGFQAVRRKASSKQAKKNKITLALGRLTVLLNKLSQNNKGECFQRLLSQSELDRKRMAYSKVFIHKLHHKVVTMRLATLSSGFKKLKFSQERRNRCAELAKFIFHFMGRQKRYRIKLGFEHIQAHSTMKQTRFSYSLQLLFRSLQAIRRKTLSAALFLLSPVNAGSCLPLYQLDGEKPVSLNSLKLKAAPSTTHFQLEQFRLQEEQASSSQVKEHTTLQPSPALIIDQIEHKSTELRLVPIAITYSPPFIHSPPQFKPVPLKRIHEIIPSEPRSSPPHCERCMCCGSCSQTVQYYSPQRLFTTPPKPSFRTKDHEIRFEPVFIESSKEFRSASPNRSYNVPLTLSNVFRGETEPRASVVRTSGPLKVFKSERVEKPRFMVREG